MHNLNRKVREYFELVTGESVSIPQCGACSTSFLPPRAVCPACGASELTWSKHEQPRATIYSLTRMANGKTIALAELDVVNGPGRLYAEVIGDFAEKAQIGDRVRINTVQQEFELSEWVPVIVPEGVEQ